MQNNSIFLSLKEFHYKLIVFSFFGTLQNKLIHTHPNNYCLFSYKEIVKLKRICMFVQSIA